MSLINEALKRARQAHARPSPAAAAEPALPMALVPALAPQPRTAWIAPATGLLALLLGLGCLGLYWLHARPNVALAARPTARVLAASNSPAIAQPSIPAPAANRVAAQPAATNTPALANLPISTNPVGRPPPSSTGSAQAPAATKDTEALAALPDASAPGFKLQGIFFGKSRVCAMINGRIVAHDDEVSGAKVLEIERQSVRLLIQGRTNILKLH